MNRCLSFIRDVEREAEHKRRCERVTKSEAIYNAALTEANEQGITLVGSKTHYVFHNRGGDRAWFYVAPNTLFVQRHGEPRSREVPIPESDVYDITLMFGDGSVLK
jgi:hypothetical protein